MNCTFAPNMTTGSSNPPTVANLYYYARGGKLTFIGQYYNTFRIDVRNPLIVGALKHKHSVISKPLPGD